MALLFPIHNLYASKDSPSVPIYNFGSFGPPIYNFSAIINGPSLPTNNFGSIVDGPSYP
jgi:hypothetical protein